MGPSGDFHEQTAITYAAGVFALCEFFATIVFEWKWIWGIRHWWSKFNAIKVVYLLAKYLGFASQLLSIVIVTLIYRGDGPTIAGCAYWVWIQLTAQWLLWTCLEALLMLRLYALYSRSKFMGFFLFTFMLAETAVAAYLSFSRLHQHFPRVHYGVSLPVPPWLFAVDEGVCFHDVKKGIPMQAVYFGIVQMAAQVTILVLTLARCIPALKVHHSLNRLLYRLVKDGFIAFVVIMGVIFVPVSAYFVGKATLMHSFPISNEILSMTTTRLIIRIQTMDSEIERETRRPSGIELTSAVSSNLDATGTDWGTNSEYHARQSSEYHAKYPARRSSATEEAIAHGKLGEAVDGKLVGKSDGRVSKLACDTRFSVTDEQKGECSTGTPTTSSRPHSFSVV
ncbi:hypothetical protein K523DRAFT_89867 [Schizophyllum commune Tattone D]|nr:hypothetical protein K523DRAFT_89867 [Schizophyllum commune Tattone D]